MCELPEDSDLFAAECAECGSEKYQILLTEDKEVFGTECVGCHLRTLFKDAVIYTGKSNPIITFN